MTWSYRLDFTDAITHVKASCWAAVVPILFSFPIRCPEKPVSILFQCDAYQLTSRSDANLGEKLLQRRFNRALRNLQTISNLLIRQTCEDKRKHPSLPFRQANSAALRVGPFRAFERPLQ
jgi:hypothetical protein